MILLACATEMGAPDLSIVIVSYNVRPYLKECLESLQAACGGLSVEVFVADNASRDGSAAFVAGEFPGVHLTVNSGNLGLSKAVNQVLPWVRGRYMLLLNPDTVVPKNALARLVEVADQWPEVGLVGPLTRDAADGALLYSFRSFPSWRQAFLRYTLARPILRLLPKPRWQPLRDQPTTCGQLVGACILIRRKVIEEIGGLDQGYFLFYEDTEYCRRAIRAGWKILYTSEAEVFHHQGKSTSQLPPESIWLLYLTGLFRYLRSEESRASWLWGGLFKSLFFCKIFVQCFESAGKIVFYRTLRRADEVAKHSRRLKRNVRLFRYVLGPAILTVDSLVALRG